MRRMARVGEVLGLLMNDGLEYVRMMQCRLGSITAVAWVIVDLLFFTSRLILVYPASWSFLCLLWAIVLVVSCCLLFEFGSHCWGLKPLSSFASSSSSSISNFLQVKFSSQWANPLFFSTKLLLPPNPRNLQLHLKFVRPHALWITRTARSLETMR